MNAIEEVYHSIPEEFHCSEEEFNKNGHEAYAECVGNYVEHLEKKVFFLENPMSL